MMIVAQGIYSVYGGSNREKRYKKKVYKEINNKKVHKEKKINGSQGEKRLKGSQGDKR